MPELFVLEFDGFDKSDYEKVNSILGIDMNTGEGDWPDGLITHSAGKTQDGWTVVEVWESREAQERFMSSRLGAALQQAGVSKPPKRADWTALHSHHHPKRRAAAPTS
jgi:uncharacterized protein (DUF927 family)